MHKFMAKIKSDNSDTKILKIIRDFSHEPIGAIKEKMTHHMPVLETEYLNLERLKSFKKTVEEITELGGELQLFLDDEKATMQFLSHRKIPKIKLRKTISICLMMRSNGSDFPI